MKRIEGQVIREQWWMAWVRKSDILKVKVKRLVDLDKIRETGVTGGKSQDR